MSLGTSPADAAVRTGPGPHGGVATPGHVTCPGPETSPRHPSSCGRLSTMDPDATGTVRTRRRGAELENAIMDAAWAELAEHGWARFTMDGVAARCGTAKRVLYRRWANRAELARAVLMHATRQDERASVSAGDLRDDLVTYLKGVAAFLRGPFGEAVLGIAADGAVPSDRIRSASDATGPVRPLVDAAVERGELPRVPDDLAINVGHALVTLALIQHRTPPDDDEVVRIVDAVWLPALGHHRP